MRISLFIILSFLYCSAIAQSLSTSPYSIYGLGDLETRAQAQHIGLGSTKYSHFNTAMINTANPATYGLLNQPVFDVNFAARQLELTSGNGSQTSSEGYFKQMAIAFPFGKGNG